MSVSDFKTKYTFYTSAFISYLTKFKVYRIVSYILIGVNIKKERIIHDSSNVSLFKI